MSSSSCRFKLVHSAGNAETSSRCFHRAHSSLARSSSIVLVISATLSYVCILDAKHLARLSQCTLITRKHQVRTRTDMCMHRHTLTEQGRKLRDHLQRVLRGELLVPQQAVTESSSGSSSTDGATAGADSSNSTAGAAAQQPSSVLDESAAHEWCCAAEALDLATPESFRHQVISSVTFT
jgi:hypothetical protein